MRLNLLGLHCAANNLFVFPAIALAAHLGQTKVITDHMLMAAAEVQSLALSKSSCTILVMALALTPRAHGSPESSGVQVLNMHMCMTA